MQAPHIFYSPSRHAWVLGDDWQTGINGSILCVKAGFLFDMASVPRILNPLIQKFELGTVAPLLHDFCYQRGGRLVEAYPPVVLSRRRVDGLFAEYMRREGVCGWRRVAAFVAVRLFGWMAWTRKQREPVRRAGRR